MRDYRAFQGLTQQDVIFLVREFFDLYGEPPRAVDWDPARAIREGKHDIAQRFDDDACWPPVSRVAGRHGQPFGCFTDAVIAAGFYPRSHHGGWNDLPLRQRASYLREGVEALKEKQKQSA